MTQEEMETTISPSVENPGAVQQPTLTDLIMKREDGAEILERSGLNKPEVISLDNAICYIGEERKGVRIVVIGKNIPINGSDSRERQWIITTSSSDSLEDRESKEGELRKLLTGRELKFDSTQIVNLVDWLAPRRPSSTGNES
jgi:hypothetical protein